MNRKSEGQTTQSRNPSASFNETTQQLIQDAKVGDVFYFDNIKVMGPDKLIRTLPSLSFEVQ